MQILTGICLALVYAPAADEAWKSLLYLNYVQPLGWFLRALHVWGSHFMIALMTIHLVQVFMFGAYKYPRELTWVVGCLLFILTLAMGFSGQVMRFDQDAYWGLGIVVSIIGRVGADARGETLRSLLEERGVETRFLVADRHYETPTKSRILAGSAHTAKQQIVRVDRGHRVVPMRAAALKRHVARARKARERGEGLVLADYGYGTVFPEWVRELGEGAGPVTLDSRFQLERYKGVDAATPNLEELERSVGVRIEDGDEAALLGAAQRLRRKLGAPALLVTKGSRGMTLVEKRGKPSEIPVFGSDEIADVTGAGDTVIAVFTAVRAAGGTWREAAELANVAGGLVVMKRGTATLSREEMLAALAAEWDVSAS